MALPTSGQITLAQIQSEWGGSNPISLSEYYLGSLPTGRTNYGSIPSSGQISLSNFYGTDAAVGNWTSTLTVGSWVFAKITSYGYTIPGFNAPNGAGAMSDDTVDTFSNRQISSLGWNFSGGLFLSFAALNLPNSGWTSIKINSTTFTRASASNFNNTSTLNTTWSWSVATNPFGTTIGATRTIEFII